MQNMAIHLLISNFTSKTSMLLHATSFLYANENKAKRNYWTDNNWIKKYDSLVQSVYEQSIKDKKY
jgi:hypothetical protein